MKQYINIPARVIPCVADNITGTEFWPYNDGNDPYWQFGATPKFYRWQLSLTITPQIHSSTTTRVPLQYNAQDIQLGDYIADTVNGLAVKVISITSKTDTTLVCVVEDLFRYNTFRDSTGVGNGIFALGSTCVAFGLNEEAQPVVDPAIVANLSGNFYNNLSSRFENLEQNYNFILNKVNHGFVAEDLIAVDPVGKTFVLANAAFPYLIGTVTGIDLGTDAFTINPFGKIVDNFDALIGDVGSVIYSDDNNAGQYSLTGSHPIMLKLIEESISIALGTVASPSTQPGNTFTLNGSTVTVGGSGAVADFLAAVNQFSAQTGVVASVFTAPTVAEPTTQPAGFLQVPGSAMINGVTVNFVTSTSGSVSLGAPGYADMNDISADINSANVPNLTAAVFTGSYGSEISLTQSQSNAIVITNLTNDQSGNPFAGPISSTGLPLATSAPTAQLVKLAAVDARAIDLLDTSGTPTYDFGLVSTENGQKAAAVYIDQGVRTASTYVVQNITALNALSALPGDTCFVTDMGDGNWAMYIKIIDGTWVRFADKPSSETDAQSIEVAVNAQSPASAVIHTITDGRRVSFVTVSVSDAFDGTPSITVGDTGQNDRLMTADLSDLTIVGDYSATPAYTYSNNGQDTDICYYFEANGCTQGNAIVSITYV